MQGPLTRGRRRKAAFAALALLLAAPAAFADPQDAAYVDSPAGKLPDPARADGGSTPPTDPLPVQPGAPSAGDQAALMQMQAQLMQQAMADARQAQAQEAAQAGTAPAQPGTAATPMQQIGAGLMQDAGGLIDAGIQRQTGGVVVNPYPQAFPSPGTSDPLAPPDSVGP